MIGIYAGSFDPFTKGHEDILLQARDLFEEVVILICDNPLKNHKFSKFDRKYIIDQYILPYDISCDILVDGWATIEYAIAHNATYLIRGLRSISDFEYELQIAHMNKLLNSDIKTIYFTPSVENQFTSSSMVREFLRYDKDISKLVPKRVENIIMNIATRGFK